MFFKAIFTSLVLVSSLSYAEASFALDPYADIVNNVEKLCKAPSNKKSSYYQVSVKGKAKLRVRILGLAGADAHFKKQEWDGVQRVLRKDQIKDNESYRSCTLALTPIFLDKFYSGVKKEKEKENRKEKEKGKSGITYQSTYGDKSPIINNPSAPIIFN